ncbi:OLC1v1021187C2 [Oldenlandia corymbosa var. corymbosa]|nr:OLC1v1021187C2 [Oldenlandia corymbosa var. corymbosa]
MDVVHVLSIYATIDLSSNKFRGVIPDAIGNLISIRGLNLSHNELGGPIPLSFANLTSLESLDLSANQIDGEIPQQLKGFDISSSAEPFQKPSDG